MDSQKSITLEELIKAAGYTMDGRQIIALEDANKLLNVEDVKTLVKAMYDDSPKTYICDIDEHSADRIAVGNQTFDVRSNDQNFQKGDYIRYRVITTSGIQKTYHKLDGETFRIQFVYCGNCLKDNHVILGIKKID